MSKNKKIGLGTIGGILILLLILSISTVSTGNSGFRVSFGKVSKETLEEGKKMYAGGGQGRESMMLMGFCAVPFVVVGVLPVLIGMSAYWLSQLRRAAGCLREPRQT